MQTLTKSILEAKVIAQNRVNQARNEQFKAITAALLPFVGKPITKVDGALRKDVCDALPKAPKDIQRWKPHNGNSLCFALKCSENYGEYTCVYAEQYVYVADMDGGTLKCVYRELEPARTDYTAAEVWKLRQACQIAKEAFNAAESALSPFGTYDN